MHLRYVQSAWIEPMTLLCWRNVLTTELQENLTLRLDFSLNVSLYQKL